MHRSPWNALTASAAASLAGASLIAAVGAAGPAHSAALDLQADRVSGELIMAAEIRSDLERLRHVAPLLGALAAGPGALLVVLAVTSLANGRPEPLSEKPRRTGWAPCVITRSDR